MRTNVNIINARDGGIFDSLDDFQMFRREDVDARIDFTAVFHRPVQMPGQLFVQL